MYLKYWLAALALTLAPLGAADFWQEKNFSEWNEKQVRRILDDSPWARPVTVSDEVRSGRIRKGGLSDAATGSRAGDHRNPAQPTEAAPAVTAILRWHSALPVKQAIARLRFGDAAESSPDAVKLLTRPEDRYVLGLSNLPAGLLGGSKEEIKTKVRLKIKGKPDIAAEDIEASREGNRASLYLVFPRARNGAPAIEVNDGEVEIEIRLPDLKISRKFKLKEMMFNGKLEI